MNISMLTDIRGDRVHDKIVFHCYYGDHKIYALRAGTKFIECFSHIIALGPSARILSLWEPALFLQWLRYINTK